MGHAERQAPPLSTVSCGWPSRLRNRNDRGRKPLAHRLLPLGILGEAPEHICTDRIGDERLLHVFDPDRLAGGLGPLPLGVAGLEDPDPLLGQVVQVCRISLLSGLYRAAQKLTDLSSLGPGEGLLLPVCGR